MEETKYVGKRGRRPGFKRTPESIAKQKATMQKKREEKIEVEATEVLKE